MDHAFPRQNSPPMVDERATQCSLIQSCRYLVGKTGEHAARDCTGRRRDIIDRQTFATRDREKLFRQLPRFTSGAGINSESGAATRVELIIFRKSEGALEQEKVGFILTPEEILPLRPDFFSLCPAKEVAARGECGN
jgi:hypothetical protein